MWVKIYNGSIIRWYTNQLTHLTHIQPNKWRSILLICWNSTYLASRMCRLWLTILMLTISSISQASRSSPVPSGSSPDSEPCSAPMMLPCVIAQWKLLKKAAGRRRMLHQNITRLNTIRHYITQLFNISTLPHIDNSTCRGCLVVLQNPVFTEASALAQSQVAPSLGTHTVSLFSTQVWVNTS